MKKLAILSVCIVLVFGLSFPSSATASDEEEVLQVINNYAKAFNTLDSDLMASLCSQSHDASAFGPDSSMALLMKGEDIVNSFKNAFSNLKSTGFSYTVSPHNVEVLMLSDDVALVTSYAISTLTNPNTNAQIISQDRGTHVLQKIDGKWLIVHTHVSVLPTK